MSKAKALKFVQSELSIKYKKLLKGEAYVLLFTPTDGFYLFDELTSLGLTFTKEYKQKVWNECKEDYQKWYSKLDKRSINDQAIQEAKRRIFKKWICDHAEIGNDISEVIEQIVK